MTLTQAINSSAKRGESLPNGFTLIDETVERFSHTPPRRTSVVLGVNPHTGEYATWHRHILVGETATGEPVVYDETFWGHYETSFWAAVEDYEKRAGITR
jgi:hypothetical protein